MPAIEDWNFIPTSIGLASPSGTMGGVADAGKKLLPVTVTVRPAPAVSRFTLSSTARDLIVNVPAVGATQL